MIDDPAEAAIRRGERAQAILEDEVFVGAFAAVEADLMAAWRVSGVADAEKREQAYRMLRALDSVRSEIARVMGEGRLAAAEVEERKREDAITAAVWGTE